MMSKEYEFYNKIKNWDFSEIDCFEETLTNWDMYEIIRASSNRNSKINEE